MLAYLGIWVTGSSQPQLMGALRQDVWARSTVAMIACGIKALVRGEEVPPKAPPAAAPAQPPVAPSRIVTVGTQA